MSTEYTLYSVYQLVDKISFMQLLYNDFNCVMIDIIYLIIVNIIFTFCFVFHIELFLFD